MRMPTTPARDVRRAGGTALRGLTKAIRDEASTLQPFGIERDAEAVVPEDLDQVAPGAAKHEKITDKGITPERLLHLQGQTVHATPHIGAPNREPDPYARRDRDHRRRSTSSTRRSARPSKLAPTRTR